MQQHDPLILVVVQSLGDDLIHFAEIIVVEKPDLQLRTFYLQVPQFKPLASAADEINLQRFSPLLLPVRFYHRGAFSDEFILCAIVVYFTIAIVEFQYAVIQHDQEGFAEVVLLRLAVEMPVAVRGSHQVPESLLNDRIRFFAIDVADVRGGGYLLKAIQVQRFPAEKSVVEYPVRIDDLLFCNLFHFLLFLLYHFIGATGTGESVRFGPESEAHSHDIAHGLFQGVVAFERGVGIDIGMHFHIHTKPAEQVAQ